MTMGEAQTLIEINRDCISPRPFRTPQRFKDGVAFLRGKAGSAYVSCATAVLVGFGLFVRDHSPA
jgi:hypothetical protein